MSLKPHSLAVAALIFLLLTALPASAGAAAPAASSRGDIEAASSLAAEFFQAFAAKDMERVGSFFAPGARVQRSRLGDGGPEIAGFDAAAWVAEAGSSIAPLEDFKIEVLESSGLGFGDGVTVSVRFRATGAVGGGRFTNDGVDTFSFARVGDAWRIVLYSSFEKLVFVPPAAAGR